MRENFNAVENETKNPSPLKKSKIPKWIYWLLIFVIGMAGGWLIKYGFDNFNKNQSSFREIRQSGFKYINPLLECEIETKEVGSLGLLKKKVAEFIDQKSGDNIIISASVYFRDLNNGPWFGLNEKEGFSPASLLKVPILITYFSAAEKDSQLLDKKIIFTGKLTEDIAVPDIDSGDEMVVGQSYSVRELMRRMIVFSDNDAKNLLLLNLDAKIFDQCYRDLGITIPDVRTPEDFMSVKDYASFFRMLFNASYLNRGFSNAALEILTEVEFKDGLMSGVDKNVEVAHKFGERVNMINGREVKQLHDCGIVYYPGHPYLICVMTRGQNFGEMAEVIKDISRIVYDEVERKSVVEE